MVTWGTITVECVSGDCHAVAEYDADFLREVSLLEALAEDGWRGSDEGHVCPHCIEEQRERERGDDDGVEYSDPRDYRAGME